MPAVNVPNSQYCCEQCGSSYFVEGQFPQMDPAWSPDGGFLLYRERRDNGTLGNPVVFLKTRFNEAGAQFSPDGRLVA